MIGNNQDLPIGAEYTLQTLPFSINGAINTIEMQVNLEVKDASIIQSEIREQSLPIESNNVDGLPKLSDTSNDLPIEQQSMKINTIVDEERSQVPREETNIHGEKGSEMEVENEQVDAKPDEIVESLRMTSAVNMIANELTASAQRRKEILIGDVLIDEEFIANPSEEFFDASSHLSSLYYHANFYRIITLIQGITPAPSSIIKNTSQQEDKLDEEEEQQQGQPQEALQQTINEPTNKTFNPQPNSEVGPDTIISEADCPTANVILAGGEKEVDENKNIVEGGGDVDAQGEKDQNKLSNAPRSQLKRISYSIHVENGSLRTVEVPMRRSRGLFEFNHIIDRLRIAPKSEECVELIIDQLSEYQSLLTKQQIRLKEIRNSNLLAKEIRDKQRRLEAKKAAVENKIKLNLQVDNSSQIQSTEVEPAVNEDQMKQTIASTSKNEILESEKAIETSAVGNVQPDFSESQITKSFAKHFPSLQVVNSPFTNGNLKNDQAAGSNTVEGLNEIEKTSWSTEVEKNCRDSINSILKSLNCKYFSYFLSWNNGASESLQKSQEVSTNVASVENTQELSLINEKDQGKYSNTTEAEKQNSEIVKQSIDQSSNIIGQMNETSNKSESEIENEDEDRSIIGHSVDFLRVFGISVPNISSQVLRVNNSFMLESKQMNRQEYFSHLRESINSAIKQTSNAIDSSALTRCCPLFFRLASQQLSLESNSSEDNCSTIEPEQFELKSFDGLPIQLKISSKLIREQQFTMYVFTYEIEQQVLQVIQDAREEQVAARAAAAAAEEQRERAAMKRSKETAAQQRRALKKRKKLSMQFPDLMPLSEQDKQHPKNINYLTSCTYFISKFYSEQPIIRERTRRQSTTDTRIKTEEDLLAAISVAGAAGGTEEKTKQKKQIRQRKLTFEAKPKGEDENIEINRKKSYTEAAGNTRNQQGSGKPLDLEHYLEEQFKLFNPQPEDHQERGTNSGGIVTASSTVPPLNSKPAAAGATKKATSRKNSKATHRLSFSKLEEENLSQLVAEADVAPNIPVNSGFSVPVAPTPTAAPRKKVTSKKLKKEDIDNSNLSISGTNNNNNNINNSSHAQLLLPQIQVSNGGGSLLATPAMSAAANPLLSTPLGMMPTPMNAALLNTPSISPLTPWRDPMYAATNPALHQPFLLDIPEEIAHLSRAYEFSPYLNANSNPGNGNMPSTPLHHFLSNPTSTPQNYPFAYNSAVAAAAYMYSHQNQHVSASQQQQQQQGQNCQQAQSLSQFSPFYQPTNGMFPLNSPLHSAIKPHHGNLMSGGSGGSNSQQAQQLQSGNSQQQQQQQQQQQHSLFAGSFAQHAGYSPQLNYSPYSIGYSLFTPANFTPSPNMLALHKQFPPPLDLNAQQQQQQQQQQTQGISFQVPQSKSLISTLQSKQQTQHYLPQFSQSSILQQVGQTQTQQTNQQSQQIHKLLNIATGTDEVIEEEGENSNSEEEDDDDDDENGGSGLKANGRMKMKKNSQSTATESRQSIMKQQNSSPTQVPTTSIIKQKRFSFGGTLNPPTVFSFVNSQHAQLHSQQQQHNLHDFESQQAHFNS